MTRRRGFTLIELLVVIGIILVLAAITFPVFSRAKVSAYRSSDISNMNSIRNALQLYRADQGAYPPALLGYVTLYDSGPDVGNVIPADQLKAALYPKRLDNINTFKPAMLRPDLTATTAAVWPPQDPRAVGSAPIKDLDGDGSITNADDLANARQKYGPGDGYYKSDGTTTTDINDATKFYKISGYDVAEVPDGVGGLRTELRYSLYWTVWGLGGGNLQDDPRQLGYSDPPEDTVVTWNSFYRDYQGSANPPHQKSDIVLFLGGGAKPYDSFDVNSYSWRILP